MSLERRAQGAGKREWEGSAHSFASCLSDREQQGRFAAVKVITSGFGMGWTQKLLVGRHNGSDLSFIRLIAGWGLFATRKVVVVLLYTWMVMGSQRPWWRTRVARSGR